MPFAIHALYLQQSIRHEVYYAPFEYINTQARLVIVGITPGVTQLKLAYAEAQRLLQSKTSEEDALRGIISAAAFGGQAMRPNLLRMLRHFDFAAILGIDDEAELWGSAAGCLHSTSVIPHATLKAGKMFAGNFCEIRESVALRKLFDQEFIKSLVELNEEVLYIALGKTPLDALRHCIDLGVIRESQVLGGFAHPSRASGSQVAIYLGEKTPDELDEADPVRGRVPWLRAAYAQMLTATKRLRGSAAPKVPVSLAQAAPLDANSDTKLTRNISRNVPDAKRTIRQTCNSDLHYVVRHGKATGTVLRPHIQDGCYIVSPTRFERDYIRVPVHQPLEPHLGRGLSLRMSAPGVAPSLISPSSILGRSRTQGVR